MEIKDLLEKKEKKEKIIMLTAYDYPTARIAEDAGIDVILVGDSYGMVKLGYQTTLPVTMEEMLIATKAVSRAIKNSFLVADMPFLSYQTGAEEAIRNAGKFLKETLAKAVKIECTVSNLNIVKAVVDSDIPVMGHIGLTPQSIYRFSGYRVQGKFAENAEKLYRLALTLEKIGVFSIVLETIPSQLAKDITDSLKIPTIGIGAGPYCDGQVLVIDDLLGLNPDFLPRHAKKYVDLYSIIKQAMENFKKDVKVGNFPSKENYTQMSEEEYLKFLRLK